MEQTLGLWNLLTLIPNGIPISLEDLAYDTKSASAYEQVILFGLTVACHVVNGLILN